VNNYIQNAIEILENVGRESLFHKVRSPDLDRKFVRNGLRDQIRPVQFQALPLGRRNRRFDYQENAAGKTSNWPSAGYANVAIAVSRLLLDSFVIAAPAGHSFALTFILSSRKRKSQSVRFGFHKSATTPSRALVADSII
jgi:hypothetical protein